MKCESQRYVERDESESEPPENKPAFSTFHVDAPSNGRGGALDATAPGNNDSDLVCPA
jgi:hypothetical protein